MKYILAPFIGFLVVVVIIAGFFFCAWALGGAIVLLTGGPELYCGPSCGTINYIGVGLVLLMGLAFAHLSITFLFTLGKAIIDAHEGRND